MLLNLAEIPASEEAGYSNSPVSYPGSLVLNDAMDRTRGLLRRSRVPIGKRSSQDLPYFFSTMLMAARVVSQSSFIEQFVPAGSKEMVKFSSGAASLETFISIRPKSYFSPG